LKTYLVANFFERYHDFGLGKTDEHECEPALCVVHLRKKKKIIENTANSARQAKLITGIS
jgi:hypothetical protein